MKRLMQAALVACLMAVVAISAYADGYTNPLIKRDFPDPSIIKAQDGYYYIYSTQTVEGRIPIYRSANLIDWTKVGAAFNEETRPVYPGKEGAIVDELWAPDINYINGKYVLYYSVSEMNEGEYNGIGVATSDRPEGPFTQVTPNVPMFTSESIGVTNSIDPFYYEDGDKKYLIWGSFNGIYAIELSDDGLSVKDGATKKKIINKHAEASTIYKRNGYYYFIGSDNEFEISDAGKSPYNIVVARSTSLTGTYRNKTGLSVISTDLTRLTTILESTDDVIGPGHCTEMIEDENGETWLLHHGYSPDELKEGGRQLYIEHVLWDSNGWPYIDQTKVAANDVRPAVPETAGYYKIYTAQDLVDFANTVNNMPNSGKIQGINAMLMNDIDMTGVDFPGIGRDSHENRRFHGILDGQGHRITNLVMDGNCVGLVTVASDNCVIRNLILDASCEFKGTGRNAAFVSCCNFPEWGTNVLRIENCGNEANVKGTDVNCAAFLGCNYNGNLKIEIENCYNTGSVKGSKESAIFSGWFGNGGSTVKNCWNIARVEEGLQENQSLGRGIGVSNYINTYNLSGQNSNVGGIDGYTEAWLANGQLAYYMNGDQTSINWYQAMGSDAHPMPLASHGQVYANGELRCDGTSAGGELVYSNNSTSAIPDHSYVDGFCSVCEAFDRNAYTPVDGYFEIANATQLYWFATYVDQVNATANGRLTADIDYSAYRTGYIGRAQDNAYAGTFDGQQHRITLNLTSTLSQTGLFAYAYGATIHDLVVDGTVTMENGHNCGGGLGGRVEGITVERVVVFTDIIDNQGNGDGTNGGIFAVTTADWRPSIISNTAYYGHILAPNRYGNGVLVGWADNGQKTYFTNCIVAPAEIRWIGGGTYTRKGCTLNNTAVVFDVIPENGETNAKEGNSITLTELPTGAACYVANGKVDGAEIWYQNIGEDRYPMPFATHNKVFANGNFTCDGTPKPGMVYSDKAGSNTDEHTFGDNDLCSTCKKHGREPEALNGVYQIATVGHLVWFADHVNTGNTDAHAALTADIAQGEAIYTPIGSAQHIYVGEFNGNGHALDMCIDNPDYDNQGVFGVITDGVFIHDLVVRGYITGHNGVGGIAGATMGGANNTLWTRLERCGNEAKITCWNNGKNAGGMIGVNYGGSASFEFNNCYNTGAIYGEESGAFSGWSGGGWSIMRNCWNSAQVNDDDRADFTRNNGTSLVNCYSIHTNGGGTTSYSVEDLASGMLTRQLNSPENDNKYTGYWDQVRGESHPVWGASIKRLVKAVQEQMEATEGSVAPIELLRDQILRK